MLRPSLGVLTSSRANFSVPTGLKTLPLGRFASKQMSILCVDYSTLHHVLHPLQIASRYYLGW
jgi:hypothetical protein